SRNCPCRRRSNCGGTVGREQAKWPGHMAQVARVRMDISYGYTILYPYGWNPGSLACAPCSWGNPTYRRHLETDYMSGSVITVTSGKGGVGKTTSSANLAVALALAGKRVIVVDADIGLRNLDLVMGLGNRILHALVDAVEGRCELQQALVRDTRVDSLHLLAAAQTRDKADVGI